MFKVGSKAKFQARIQQVALEDKVGNSTIYINARLQFRGYLKE